MTNLLEKLRKVTIRPDVLKSLPEAPGVYVFFKGSIPIYIGKAINLKRRVSSYFDLDLEPKTARMVGEAKYLSYVKVTSELEALLLEARLIRKYMPHYNIAAKDDKHPLYIRITKEKYPRILTVRKIAEKERNIAFYGPFPSSRSIYTVLRMLRGIFPYSDHKLGPRRCLYSHIGLCNPCPSEIERIDNSVERLVLRRNYLKNIRSVKSILDGRVDTVSRNLEREMKIYSTSQNYEEAAKVRNQLNHLEYITRPQIPPEFYMENPNLYEDTRRREIDDLEKLIGNVKLNRIECFDIAHLSGTNATASMVTFANGEADKQYYRHFKIRVAKGGDDYDSLREVAIRRSRHFDDWGIPGLIIVDGGVGQVKAFTSILYSNEVKVPVVGIAKHPDRLIVGDQKIKLVGPALNLVARMRDEAHRFARRYHHQLISKLYKNANVN